MRINRHSSVVGLSLTASNAIIFAPKLADRVASELRNEHDLRVYVSTKTNTIRVTIGETTYWVSEFSYIKPLSLEENIIDTGLIV